MSPLHARINTAKNKSISTAICAVFYVLAVLGVDTLAAHGVADWGMFAWRTREGLDLFKFLAWLVVPLLICLPQMDWGYLGIRRLRRVDLWLFAGVAVIGLGAVGVIPLFPSLTATYGGLNIASAAAKWHYAARNLVWLGSWFFGWEFLHRYFLLRAVSRVWPRYGWLAAPLSEGLYHLQKPWPEMAGMVVFSVCVTLWAARRRNMLLPLFGHAAIELALLAFLLLA